MIGHTLRIFTPCHSDDFIRCLKFFLFHNLEVTYDVHCSLRCYQCKFVEFVVLEEFISYLYYAFLSGSLACKVDSDCYLAFNVLEVKKIQCLIYVLCRNMVQHCAILQGAYH